MSKSSRFVGGWFRLGGLVGEEDLLRRKPDQLGDAAPPLRVLWRVGRQARVRVRAEVAMLWPSTHEGQATQWLSTGYDSLHEEGIETTAR